MPAKPSPRERRKRLGLTLAQVARALGVSVSSVQSWEVGRHRPSAQEADRWAAWLGTQERRRIRDLSRGSTAG